LQHLIAKQLETLEAEDRRLLEVASVSGITFTPAEVAAGCHQAVHTIETRCEQLARRGQFLVEKGVAEWPDGTLTMYYRFRCVFHTKSATDFTRILPPNSVQDCH
jgi:hypothetical protein